MKIRDEIHGDIELSQLEQELVETPIFERLRNIKQLAFAEYEYPGANHTRYQHSIGVCQCITDIYKAVCSNSPEFYRAGDLELLRYIGLTHDLGHAPFSHAGEDLSEITHEERLKDILKLLSKYIVLEHNHYGIPDWELVYQVYNGTGSVYLSDRHLITLHDFMDGIVDADKLDYLERDALNCGVKYGLFDRQGLVNNLCIVRNELGMETLGILQEGIQALEGFILARYYMFNQVYMHPAERILRKMATLEVKSMLPQGKYPLDINKFLKYDDTKFMGKLKCLRERHAFQLVYDGTFNSRLINVLKNRLGSKIVIDAPQKTIYRTSDDSPTIMVKTLIGRVIPCEALSPILKNIASASIHKLRVYVNTQDANIDIDKVKNSIEGLVNKYD